MRIPVIASSAATKQSSLAFGSGLLCSARNEGAASSPDFDPAIHLVRRKHFAKNDGYAGQARV
jgi:hypothetical protein